MQRTWLLQATPVANLRAFGSTRSSAPPTRRSRQWSKATRQGQEPVPGPSEPGSQPAGSPLENLSHRLVASSRPSDGQNLLLLAAALVGVAALAAAPGAAVAGGEGYHSHSAQVLFDIAEGEAGFWSNVLRYISYFFSVLLGTAYVALKPLVDLFKRPTTALLALGGIVGLIAFVSFTVNAMLGVTEPFEYNP
ncbi:hypothetical protein N2152v2_009177 [Parachlorella kessleri]